MEQFVTGQEAAKLLNMHVNTIYKRVRKNEIPGAKKKGDRACRIPRSWVYQERARIYREMQRAAKLETAADVLREFYVHQYTEVVASLKEPIAGLCDWYADLDRRYEEGQNPNADAEFMKQHVSLMRQLMKDVDTFRRVISIDPFVKQLESEARSTFLATSAEPSAEDD